MGKHGELEAKAHDVLISEIGKGEANAAGNNAGFDIERWRRLDGTGQPVKAADPWCAALRSYSYIAAAVALGDTVPFATSRSAKTLAVNVAKAGRWIVEPGKAYAGTFLDLAMVRGALICWHRGQGWQGHVGSIDRIDMERKAVVTIEGNMNNRGLTTERYAVVDYFYHPFDTFFKNLYGIATLR